MAFPAQLPGDRFWNYDRHSLDLAEAGNHSGVIQQVIVRDEAEGIQSRVEPWPHVPDQGRQFGVSYRHV